MRAFRNCHVKSLKLRREHKEPPNRASSAASLFLPHFDVICDLLLDRCTATWNLFDKQMVDTMIIYSWSRTRHCWRAWLPILNIFLTTFKSFAQVKFYIFWKNYPSLMKVLNHMKFGEMAHGQNSNSSHRSTKLTLENTLVLFAAK